MTTELDPIEVRLVLEAIRAKYGYDFRDYTPATIERRLRAVLARNGIAHLGELQHQLLHQPTFFYRLLDELTVQVSDFFRDPGFFRAFRRKVVPVLRTYPQVKIWHAGCAIFPTTTRSGTAGSRCARACGRTWSSSNTIWCTTTRSAK